LNVKLVIADDHHIVRQGLETFLKHDSEIEIVGMAVNGFEAVEKTRELKPDVVLMDLNMPVMNGIEATASIKLEMPNVRVLILTSILDESLILKALQAGADGYVIKGKNVDDLIQSIKGYNLPIPNG
jgi:DNA-binding NarL/FixJ family response regulator